jgi:hypothetical protein
MSMGPYIKRGDSLTLEEKVPSSVGPYTGGKYTLQRTSEGRCKIAQGNRKADKEEK